MNQLKTGLLVLCWCLAGSANAFEQGVTADGIRYASGGVSEEDREALQALSERFSLWVVTAVRKSGAYLSDVRVTVSTDHRQIVFDAPLAGPWLFIGLPLGSYAVDARLGGQTQQRTTTIHPGDHHQAVFYFDDDADPRMSR